MELEELFVDVLVAAVDVIEARDRGGAFGGESGEDESSGRTKIAGHHGGGGELFYAFDDRGAAIDIDVGAHTFHFRAVHEALREDGVLYDGNAGRGGEHGSHLRLHIGRVAGIGRGVDFGTNGIFAAMNRNTIARFIELKNVAAVFKNFRDGGHLGAADAMQCYAFACDDGGCHEGPGFDAIRDDGVLDAA